MNKYTGEVTIDIAGKARTLVFDWEALSYMHSQLDAEEIANFMQKVDPKVIAKIAVAGLKRHHPKITEKDLIAASPPLVPLANALDKALSFAYFGPEDAQKTEVQKQEEQGEKKTA